MLIETYSRIPYEDYCEIQKDAEARWDKYSKANIRLGDNIQRIEFFKVIEKNKLGFIKYFGCLAYYVKMNDNFVIAKFKTCFKKHGGKPLYIKDYTYKVENLRFASEEKLKNYVKTIAFNMSEELKKRPELIPDI